MKQYTQQGATLVLVLIYVFIITLMAMASFEVTLLNGRLTQAHWLQVQKEVKVMAKRRVVDEQP